jgi:hypothetical protein
MTDSEAKAILPGTSAWRNLNAADAAHVVRVHQAANPAPRSVPVFDERRPEQHRPSMDDAPWFFDRDRHYGSDGDED